MLSARIFSVACAITVFICLVGGPVSAHVTNAPAVTQTASTAPASQSTTAQVTRARRVGTPAPLPLVAMVGTLALVSAATFWDRRTRAR